MKYNFIISGIKQNEVQHLFCLNERELQAKGIFKIKVDEKPGFPCRISLEDVNIGEEILAFSYEHHKVNSPYRSSGPVFVRFGVEEASLGKNEMPEMLNHRYLSLRAYDNEGMKIDATTIQGKTLEDTIQTIFDNEKVRYIQVHNAKPGCYICQIDRMENEINFLS